MNPTAQNPATISQADLDALRATLVIVKEDRKFVVRDANGDLVKQLGTKKGAAETFVANYIPDFTNVGDTDTTPQEPTEMIPTETPTDLPVIHAELILTEPADATTPIEPTTDIHRPTETEVTKEEVQLTPEEQAAFDKKQARSEKLRAAMAAVLEKVKAGGYDPKDSHPSEKTKKSLLVTLEGQDEAAQLPAVLHHRAIASFSEKSMVDGVTFEGVPVNAARTRGTWGGRKTAFLWIEAPALMFPNTMVGATSREVVTFHMLLDNYDDFDNLEGATVCLDPAMEEATPAPAPKSKVKADKPTPTEDTPTPAEREHAQA